MALSNGATSIPTSVVAVALPQIHQEFNASISELQWTLTAFNLAYSALLIAAGRLSDVFGRRVFFLVGSAIYALGALAASLAPGAFWLIVSVAIMGVGAAILTPASLSILRNAYEADELGTAVGIWGTMGTIVAGVGPALGGVLTDWEWRSVFWINVPIAAIFFLLALTSTRESRDPQAERAIDVAGLSTLVAGLTALSLALIQGQTWGWTSTPTIVLFAAGVAMLIAFAVIERRVRNALVDFALFRRRNFAGANVTVFALNFVLAALLFFLPLYLQELLAYTPLKSGILLLPLSATMAVTLISGGKIADRIGTPIPITAGLLMTAVGSYLLTRLSVTSDYTTIWPALLVLGAGLGLTITPLNIAAITAVSRAKAGLAAGILTTIGGLGGVFGVALSGGLFQQQQDSEMDRLLAQSGLHLSNSTERELLGILTGAEDAKKELAKFSKASQEHIVNAVHDSFVFAISNVMWLSAGLALACGIFTALVMRREPPAEEPAALEIGLADEALTE
jgi:EmrB/QacA subfamily drug resistance transporter